jgi:lipoyl(octanoyl) transferase
MAGRTLKALQPLYPVFDLGVAPYEPVQELQKRLRVAVADGRIPGVLLLLEHSPVITLGSRAGPHDLRHAERAAMAHIDVIVSERGGQATLHAPGQLVSYLIVPIPARDLTTYVYHLEEAIIVVLAALGIEGERRQRRPGVYVAGDKISSVGLRCQRWISSHGTSLNVGIDLSLFDTIISCGEPDLAQTSIGLLLGTAPPMDTIKTLYIQAVKRVFGWQLSPPVRAPFDSVEELLGTAR